MKNKIASCWWQVRQGKRGLDLCASPCLPRELLQQKLNARHSNITRIKFLGKSSAWLSATNKRGCCMGKACRLNVFIQHFLFKSTSEC